MMIIGLARLTSRSSQVVQLNSLRPTNDAFCALLRTRLKASLPMMKSLKVSNACLAPM